MPLFENYITNFLTPGIYETMAIRKCWIIGMVFYNIPMMERLDIRFKLPCDRLDTHECTSRKP